MSAVRMHKMVADLALWSRRPHTHAQFLLWVQQEYPDFMGKTDALWTISQLEQDAAARKVALRALPVL